VFDLRSKSIFAVEAAMVFAALFSGVVASAKPQQSSDAVADAVPHVGEPAQITVPRLVQFNGTLKDSAARPISGAASVTFAIYAEQDGGSPLWSETQNVLADALGHYNVLLGSATTSGVPADLFGTGQSRWLGVTIARQPEMSRVLMASVPYALKAGDADTLGGLPASAYVTTQSLAAKPSTTLTPGSSTIIATPQTAASANAPASVTQATPTGTGTTNFIPLWTSSSNLGNSILFQTSSRIGVGTTSPVVTLDVNGDSIFRGSFQLVPQGTATASTGQLSHSYQWEASTFNSSTNAPVVTAYGFRATPVGNNTSSPTSSLDLYYGPGGGTLTDTGLSINNKGIITFASGQTFPGGGGGSGSFTELSLPNTTSSTSGVITFGGTPFISDLGNSTNTFIGGGAGATSTAGGGNVAVGSGAGTKNSTGSSNTFLGVNANANAANLTNATAIGERAQVNASNSMVLGAINGVNGAGSDTKIGIGTTTPHSALEVSGTTASNIENPSPNLTISNTANTFDNTGSVSIDFVPYITGAATPAARIEAQDDGEDSAYLYFNVKTPGSPTNTFNTAMEIDDDGSVFFSGDVAVNGNLTKESGTFKIDDPIAPSQKYLSHSFVESPDMMNIYNGTATLDANGEAIVTMPEWFDALNQSFQYQLTAVGAPGPGLYVKEKVHDNRFRIAGGAAGLEVSWQVTGVRHDAWANAHRTPVEEEKPEIDQGRYLNPELFGAGPEKRVALAHKHGSSSKPVAPVLTADPGDAPNATAGYKQ
jgi:trimeric autotransporter adhesin